jgi:tetratricopeptide (TPR) repeat protein/transcriptional regulator with XRE-family HTH domain
LTQEALAERAGISSRSLREIERSGGRSPRPHTALRLADALELAGDEREEFVEAGQAQHWDSRAGRPDRKGSALRGAQAPDVPTWYRPLVVPRQLPADVTGFAGRAEHLRRLDALLSGPGDPVPIVAISAIAGTAGVGKTALAVHWASRVVDRFPDGQLYVNLRGFDPSSSPMRVADAVRGFLHALGVPAERIPPHLDAQAALYRSLIAGKRMLVVLDNARDAEQVRPLLPGTPTVLAVVTSRSQLSPLVAGSGAEPITLDVLSAVEARELLVRRLGTDRVAAEREAADRIIDACARLPLALTIAAARARHTGFPLAAVAVELHDGGRRLDALDAGDSASQVRGVFSWSYTALSSAAARLFRLLGRHQGPDISVAAVASLLGQPVAETRRLLAELTRVNMLIEHAPGRYSFHDLLRTYANELANGHDSDDERHAATIRLVDHYVHTGHSAALLILPHRDPIAMPLTPPSTGTRPEEFADHDEAMAWLSIEHPVVLAVLKYAAAAGFDTHAWQLVWTLDTFLDRHGHWDDWAAGWQVALAAAERVDHTQARGYALRNCAHAAIRAGRWPDAETPLRHALDLYTRAGDRAGQADTHLSLAISCSRQGTPKRALEHARQALGLFRAVGDRRGQALTLNALGWYYAKLGEHHQALTFCEQGLALFQEIGDRDGEAAACDSVGYAHHYLGRYPSAASAYRCAIELYHALGDRYEEATSLTRLGDTHDAAGDPDAALEAWQHALDILTDVDHPDAGSVQTKLRNVRRGGAPPMRGLVRA